MPSAARDFADVSRRWFSLARLRTIAIVLGLMLAPLAGIYFLTETTFSRAKLSWHSRFEHELLDEGEVSLGGLVDFAWDKIYLLETYDLLNTQQEARLFPMRGWSYPFSFWWEHTEGYWTIAYQRPGTSPFLVRMRKTHWYLRNLTNAWTVDPNAKLRLVRQPDRSHLLRSSITRPLPFARQREQSDAHIAVASLGARSRVQIELSSACMQP